jgi:hypothetical protein
MPQQETFSNVQPIETFSNVAPISTDADTQKPRTWTDSVSDFGKELWNQVNPVSGIKGAAQLAAHPIDTLKSDADARQQVYNNAEQAFKKGNYSEGAAHLLYAALPFIGPQLDAAGNNFVQGNYAKGAGASIGMGINLFGAEGLKNAAISLPGAGTVEDLSKRMYQSSLKPPPGSYSQPEVQSMVKTGLENEIPVSAEGRVKLQSLITDLNDKVQQQIQTGSNAGATINKFDVASRLGKTAQKFSSQVTPISDLNAIGETGNEFLANQPNEIPAATAQSLKSGTYQQLKDTAYGQLKNATIEAQKSLARGIKEELQTQFPEIQGLNAQESQAINLDGALERAVNRTTNRDIFSLGGKIASGTGAVVGAAAAGEAGAAAGAVAGPLIHHFLSDPEVQSKLAIAVNKASKGKITIPAANARVLGYMNQLGNAISNSGNSADTATGTSAQ